MLSGNGSHLGCLQSYLEMPGVETGSFCMRSIESWPFPYFLVGFLLWLSIQLVRSKFVQVVCSTESWLSGFHLVHLGTSGLQCTLHSFSHQNTHLLARDGNLHLDRQLHQQCEMEVFLCMRFSPIRFDRLWGRNFNWKQWDLRPVNVFEIRMPFCPQLETFPFWINRQIQERKLNS